MTPVAFSLVSIAGIFILSLPRHYAIIPLIIGITLIPMGSVLYIGPANFHTMRILVFLGMLRIITKKESLSGGFNGIDICMVLWAIVMLITGAAQPKLDTTFITRLGEVYDAAGLYFVMRFFVKDQADIFTIFKTLAVILCIMSLFMIVEKITQFNPFSLFGGVRSSPAVRSGRVRCQGPFTSAIMAGTVAATSISWFFVLYKIKNFPRLFVFSGATAAILVVFLSASSGPIMSMLLCAVGFAFWPFRDNMKAVRITLFLFILILHLTMSSPVWYIMAKIDLTGSSTGWHRAELINSAIKYIGEWWMIGTTYTRHWMPTGIAWSPNHTDITNQYIKNGVAGGILAMILFIVKINFGFKYIGNTLKKISESNSLYKLLVWSLGATLFSHTVTFLSVRYYDQSMMYFYLLLAMICCSQYCFSLKSSTDSVQTKKNEVCYGFRNHPSIN